MKCPMCGKETTAVFETEQKRDGHVLWGCSECRDGRSPDLAETVVKSFEIIKELSIHKEAPRG